MAEDGVMIDVHCSVCYGFQRFKVKEATSGYLQALDYLITSTDWTVVNGEPICPEHQPNLFARGVYYGLLFSIPIWAVILAFGYLIWSIYR